MGRSLLCVALLGLLVSVRAQGWFGQDFDPWGDGGDDGLPGWGPSFGGWNQGGWQPPTPPSPPAPPPPAITMATCVAKDPYDDIKVKATITQRSPWLGGLELALRYDTGPSFSEDVKVVITRLGAGQNTGGCSPKNLGDILVRRQTIIPNPWMMVSSNPNGVIRELSLDKNEDNELVTLTDLPISSLQEVFGTSLAFCRDVEEVKGDSSSGRWGSSDWLGRNLFPFMRRSSAPRYQCTDDVILCCTFGRAIEEAN